MNLFKRIAVGTAVALTGILGVSACTIQITSGKPSPSASAPASSPSVDGPTSYPSEETQPSEAPVGTPTSAKDIAPQVGCTDWTYKDMSQDGYRLDYADSKQCSAIIEYSGMPGFADAVYSKLLNNPDVAGWYFVNGDTWLIVVHTLSDAQELADLYGVTWEVL